MMRKMCWWLALPFVLLTFVACSYDDYLNSIPAESKALMAIDASRLLAGEETPEAKEGALRKLFQIDDLADCGIDLSEKVYLFESPDGDLGLCAKVASSADLGRWLERLAGKGLCERVNEWNDARFTTLKNTWLLGYTDDVLLVMGPVVGEAKAQKRQQMARYLEAKEEEGVKASPLFQRLDTIQSPLALVAQAEALPGALVAPFTLGLPRGADPSQVIIEARMTNANGTLLIKGKTSSLDAQMGESLRESAQVLRPVTDEYMSTVSPDILGCLLINVDGERFLPLLQGNEQTQALLVGINTAIDMDNIIRSVNGDMLLSLTGFAGDKPMVGMGAKLAHSDWLKDVGYWKESCPAGTSLTDWGNDAYHFQGKDIDFYFGVGDGLRFYGGSDPRVAKAMLSTSTRPLDDMSRGEITGKRMILAVNLRQWAKLKPELRVVSRCLTPLFGEFHVVVFCLE